MKQYLLSVHYVDDAPATPAEEMEKAYAQVDVLNKQMQAKGAWVFGGGLEPPDIATVVRSTESGTTMTDGPFAESKEQVGGFWILQCQDLDEALEWAKLATVACMGPVEVRPFQDEPEI